MSSSVLEQCGLPQSAVDAMCEVFSQHPAVESALLYGSRAIGNFHKGSDIDLTLTGNVSHDELLQLEQELDDLLLPYQLDLSIFNSLSNPDLIEHIRRVGKVFYPSC